MNFGPAANEVLNWAGQPTHLAVAAAFTAAAAIAYVKLRDHFASPTPTGLDDPKVKTSHNRLRERFRRLGLPFSEP